jgi:TolB-like protein
LLSKPFVNESVLPPAPADRPAKRLLRKKDRVRSAWISFTGRILAQLIGAAATVGFGLLFLHKAHSGDAPQTTNPVSTTATVSYTAERIRKPGQTVLAVLPLDDYSKDAQPDHFVDGITEALITDLSQSDSVRVISRTSSMHYKTRQVPIPDVGRELGVDFVVEGSAVRDGARVRVTAQLIDARTDEHVWARSYDRSASDVLSVQSEVAGLIAREIDALLSTPAAGAKLTAN